MPGRSHQILFLMKQNKNKIKIVQFSVSAGVVWELDNCHASYFTLCLFHMNFDPLAEVAWQFSLAVALCL